jgi:hypothetical protein
MSNVITPIGTRRGSDPDSHGRAPAHQVRHDALRVAKVGVRTTTSSAVRGSIPVPEQRAKMIAGHEGIDAAVAAVAAGAGPWAATAPAERAQLCA